LTSRDSIFSTRPIKNRGIKKESRKISFLLYEAFYGPLVFLRATYRQLIVLGAMFLSGAAILGTYNKLPLLSAVLASVSTITTIGLYVPNGGNFKTMPSTESALLIFMIIVSVGAGASIVQRTVGAVTTGELAKGEAEKRLITRLRIMP
jgi:hypothetical protein